MAGLGQQREPWQTIGYLSSTATDPEFYRLQQCMALVRVKLRSLI